MSDKGKQQIPAANEKPQNDTGLNNRGGYTPTNTTNELPKPPAGGSGEKSK